MQQCWFNLPVKQQYRNVYQILRNFGALEWATFFEAWLEVIYNLSSVQKLLGTVQN
jgi:hypothetical protein